MGINSCGRSKHSDYSFSWPRLSRGGKINDNIVSQLLLEHNIWQAKLSVFLKKIFFVSLKSTKITSKIQISEVCLGHFGHVTYSFINMLFISMEIFHDKLRPQILSVGTTANSPLCWKTSLKSESVYRRRTDKTMAKRKSTNNDLQNIHIKLKIK